MSCGGRVYKGDTVTISVPFDVDDYSNLTITYTTIGDEKIVKTQEEVEIEDGFITYTFEPGELDLLPDGVIYYTIECEVNGVPNVDSTNTNLYLKTPAGYSGKTAEDYYQEGYEAGLEDCSGSTDCSSAVTEAYQSGVTEGMAEQKALLGSATFTHNNTFTNNNGWSSVTVNVPKEVVLGELAATPLSNQLQNDKYYIKEFKSGLTVDGWGRVQIDMTQML